LAPHPKITVNMMTSLKWFSEGRSPSEISRIEGVPLDEVNGQLFAASRLLNTASFQEAVQAAARLGLL